MGTRLPGPSAGWTDWACLVIGRDEVAIRDDEHLVGQPLDIGDLFFQVLDDLCRIPFLEHDPVRADFGTVGEEDFQVSLADASLRHPGFAVARNCKGGHRSLVFSDASGSLGATG